MTVAASYNLYEFVAELDAFDDAFFGHPPREESLAVGECRVSANAASSVVRKVLASRPHDRARVSELVPPEVLLSALWTPAVGGVLKAAVRDAPGPLSVSRASVARWISAKVTPEPGRLKAVLGEVGLDVTEVLAGAEWSFTGGVPHPAQAEWFLAVRSGLGLSVAVMAQRLGVSAYVYSLWERGRVAVSQEQGATAVRHLRRLGVECSLEQLTAFREPEPARDSLTELGRVLGRGRVASRLSAVSAAARLGISVNRFHDWEAGRGQVHPEFLVRLREVLALDVTEVTAALMSDRGDRRDRGAWISARAAAVGLGHDALGQQMGVRATTIAHWLQCRTPMPESRLPALADALETTVDEVRAWPWVPSEENRAGAALRARRLERGLTMEALAALMGTRKAVISELERGAGSAQMRARVAEALAA